MKPFDLLTPAAAILAIGTQWWQRAGRELPGQPEWYLYAAAGLVVLHALMRGRELLALFSRRNFKYGTNTLVTSVAVLAILGITNWMVARNNKRWDLTKGRQWSLSDQTQKVLGALEGEAKLTYFNRDTGAGDPGRDRLREYEAASHQLKVVYVDPTQKPGLTREYDITAVPTLVVEYQGKREKVTNVTEQDVTNALIAVTRKGEKTVCFAEGEGQRSIDEMGEAGFSAAKGALEKASYKTKKIALLREPKVPAECTVVVLGGPEKDLMQPAIDALRTYVAGGGKLLAMVEPELRGGVPALVALLAEWNIEAGKDLVLDVSGVGQVFGLGPAAPVADSYPYHEITRDFRVATVFATARSVSAGAASKPGVFAQNLVQTSPRSWAETNLKDLQEPMPQPEEKKGPISLAAVATIKAPGAEAAPGAAPTPTPEGEASAPEGRVVAFGDSDFATNQFLQISGNADFFLNCVAWLARDTDLIAIRPKEPEDQKLFLSPDQQRRVSWLALFVLPGLWVVLGIMNWWQRR